MGMRKFFQDEDGVGAIEFALIAPMLALFTLGIMSGWSYFDQKREMRDSVEAAAKYYIQGGTTDATARTIANSAWTDKPTGGTVAVTQSCVCASVSVSCGAGTICSSGSVPEIHKTIMATAHWTDRYSTALTGFYNRWFHATSIQLNETEVVRVR